MIGARGAAQLLLDALAARIVARLALLEASAGALVEGAVAEPRLLSATPLPPETVGLDDWPFITATPARSPAFRRTDAGTVADTYLATHELRLVAWVTGPGYVETDAARDRLVLALVELLLTEGLLGTDAAVLRESIAVDWSPIGVDEDLAATVGAAAITCTVGVEELLELEPGPTDSLADGWALEVDAAPGAFGDTLGRIGGPPPDGTV